MKATSGDSHVRVVPMEGVGPALIFQLRELIAKGDCVGMLADRIVPGSSEKVVRAPFLGADAPFPAGPFVLSSLLECPVYLVFALRGADGIYDVYFERFADRIELPRERRDAELRRYAGEFAARLERYCRQEPFQFFNFYDFWSQR